jgi:hypothetical protein
MNFRSHVSHTLGVCAAAVLQCTLLVGCAEAQTTPAQPVSATQPAQVTEVGLAKATPAAPLDFTQKQGEHPLAAVVRALKISEGEIDHNIRDYQCTFAKRERVDGELGDYQIITLKVMQQPFSVYMNFQKPYAGREVVYVAGQNDGKLTVLDAGFTRMLGKLSLDPTGPRAMSGQKHPITDVGIRNLSAKLTKMWENEMQFAECDVTVKPNIKVEGRNTTMVQVVHPVARQNFKFNAARVFFDDELKIPVHFDAYSWPVKEGGEPQLEESYTYAKNLKVNNSLTARDFDANNNPDIFKK